MNTENNFTNLEYLEDIRIAGQRMSDIYAGRTKTVTLEEVTSLIPIATSKPRGMLTNVTFDAEAPDTLDTDMADLFDGES